MSRQAQASGDLISTQRTFIWSPMDSTNRRCRIAGGLIPINVQEGAVAGWLQVTEALAGRQQCPFRPPSIRSILSTPSILSRNPTPPGGVAAPDGKARLRRCVAVVSRQAQASGDLIRPQRTFVWGTIRSTNRRHLFAGG